MGSIALVQEFEFQSFRTLMARGLESKGVGLHFSSVLGFRV